MQARFARLFLIAAVAALPLTQSLQASAASPDVRAEEKENSELGKLMGQINKHLKSLKKNIEDAAQKDSNVKDFNGIAELADKCKAHAPETAKTDEEKKTYADMLGQMAATAKDGAKAAGAGDVEGAKKAYEALKKGKADGHKKFIPADK